MRRPSWTSTRSTSVGSPCTTRRSCEAVAAAGQRVRALTVIDQRTTASLARIAATVAVDAAPASFQHAVANGPVRGRAPRWTRSSTCLEAVVPVTGAARVVQCAPKVGLALGYDVDAALERREP